MRPIMHSYALRDYPLAHVMRVAAACGWPAIELSSWHFDAGSEAGNSLAAAVEAGRHHRVEIFCAGYWAVFTTDDEAERVYWVDKLCALVDGCAANGITLINGAGGWLVRDAEHWDRDWTVNGSAMASAAHLEQVADCYRRVAEYAADRGVRVAVEVHPNTVHDTVAATARLIALVGHDNLLVTLDPANSVAIDDADLNPAVVDLVADRVAYFHLKNCMLRDGGADFTVDAAAGIVDNYRWLARIAELPAVTAVCVEYCGAGDPHPRLAAGRRYLEDTLRLVALQRRAPAG
jgi:sugar phosphate isomerase/epimerase